MPSIIPDVELATLDSKQVAAIRIGEFPVKPVACWDRYFKRVANSNHRLSLTEIANLHLQSLQLSWDSYMDVNSTLNDLNRDKIKIFLQRVTEGGRFKTASTIIDDRMIRGTPFHVVEESMKFILSHLKVAFEITVP